MKQFGLIGYPLSHSISKQYFTDKFEKLRLTDHSYDLYPLENIEDLPKLAFMRKKKKMFQEYKTLLSSIKNLD